MKRLTVEEVLTAYKVAQVTPRFGAWYEEKDNCACAIGAIYVAQKGKEQGKLLTRYENGKAKYYEEIRDTLVEDAGLEKEYISGFINGFDNGDNISLLVGRKSEEYKIGREDGILIRKAVLEKYPHTIHAEDTWGEGDEE